MNIDSNPDNADWLRISRAKRIAEKVLGGGQLWKDAVAEAQGSQSAALVIFYRLLREAGVEYEAYL